MNRTYPPSPANKIFTECIMDHHTNYHHKHEQPQYIYIYNNAAHIVQPNEDIPLDINGIMTPAFIHNNGSSVVVIKECGVYKITFNITTDGSANQIGLVINNHIQWGSIYGSATGSNWGQLIIPLNEGDVISFRNMSGSPVTLVPAYYDIFNITNTSLLVQKIGDIAVPGGGPM
jgi:hypothetical protein